MKLVDSQRADYIDVRPDAMRDFNEEVQEAMKGTVWATGCTSWYQQEGGKNVAIWPWSTWRYWLRTRKPKASDYDVVRCQPAAVTRSPGESSAASSLPRDGG
ncbi:MAG: hypothetical protein H5U40_08195 [Polyangiaceae bacterium]|nr:hypothetical protein [Polyangiaceae bacterium]